MYFHDPRVLLDFGPTLEIAREDGFLANPEATTDERLSRTLAAITMAGCNINPANGAFKTGGTVLALAGRLHEIARAQPDLEGQAERNATLITVKANLAAQDASLPVTIRRIGGLAAWGLPSDLWSDKEIAKLQPNEKGERVLTFDSTSDKDGHYSQITMRELSNQEILDVGNSWNADPALLVRTRRFGAISAQFLRDSSAVSFESTSTGGLTVALQAGETTFSHSTSTPFLNRIRYHEESGGQLKTVLSAADELTKDLQSQVRPYIQAMLDLHGVQPIPVITKQPDWWTHPPY